MNLALILPLLSTLSFGLLAIFFSLKEEKTKKLLLEQEHLHKHQLYQISILKEIQDKIGYSLDIEKAIDVITGSISGIFSYSTVSSIILKDDRWIFKAHVEEIVDKTFIENVKKSMLDSLRALTQLSPPKLEEIILGAALSQSSKPLSSFFHIPLVVNNKVAGLISISSTKPNLYKEEEMTILYQITGHASNALSRLQQVLKTEEKKREDLMNMMIHELRAPLTAIKDSSELLISSIESLEKEDRKNLLNIIHNQSKTLLGQIGEVLDAAKLEAGKLSIIKISQNNVVKLIKENLLEFAPQASKKQITIALEGGINIPLISIDPLRINQVISNLLSNSLKFTLPGGRVTVKPELIEISSTKYVKISVSDTGIGISKDKLPYIFSKYSQASNTKGSTGLGLYVVRKIVEGHGGTVNLKSQEGKGTTVSFTLPVENKLPKITKPAEENSYLRTKMLN